MQALTLLALCFGQILAQTFYDCAHDSKCTVLATGLKSPRHLDGNGGKWYVAEAGTGGNLGCFTVPVLGEYCYGLTSGITAVSWGQSQSGRGGASRLVTDAPSIANAFEQLGIGSVAVSGNDIYFTLGFTSPANFGGAFDKQSWLGTVRKTKANGHGSSEHVADVAGAEGRFNPDHGPIETNANSICAGNKKGIFYVVDAAGNSVYELDTKRGDVLTPLAAFDDIEFTTEDGEEGSVDFVPTQCRMGRDGHLYVSSLTGFRIDANGVPHPVPGIAKIVRIRLDHSGRGRVEDYRSNFTNIVDFIFTPQDDLLVLEIDHNGVLSGTWEGALIKVSEDGCTRTPLIGAGSRRDPLFAPFGINLKDDRSVLITEGSVTDHGRLLSFSNLL